MSDLKTKFAALTKKTYIQQAQWFLNGFWANGIDQEAETVWKYAQKFIELDPRKKEGNELDEFWSHKFLETNGETLTIIQLRDKLRKIDLDFNGKMALIEFLIFRFNKGAQETVDSPQGDNSKEVEKAQATLQAVANALSELQRELSDQEKALKEQVVAENNAKKAAHEAKLAAEAAKKALDEQKIAEETVRRSEDELRNAVDELKKQEDGYKNQLNTLEARSKDSTSTIVQRNKAANELAQLKLEDPLPLRKAKLSQEAALRKVEKERKAAEAATALAENAARNAEKLAKEADNMAKEAERTRKSLEEQKKKVEAAVADTEEKMKEAQIALEEAKKKGGSPLGSIWWMERELKEAQKYLPKSKQMKL